MSISVAVPPSVVNLIQQGMLQRAFHEGLYPNLGFRAEALMEEWPAGSGEEHFMTREGIIAPVTKPIVPGTDPLPSETPYEQWTAKLEQFANAKDVNIPTAAVAASNLFLAGIKQMGLNAGQSINRVARNRLFKAYLSGNSVTTAALLAGATTIPVAALNGFRDVITSITIRPMPVSPSTPLAATIGVGGTSEVVSIIAFNPNNAADPDGPGTLTLAAGLVNGYATRAPFVSAYAPKVIRSSGGASIDSIGPSDTLNLQQVINAVAALRDANVPPHEDGFFHAHISGAANAQFYQDPVFQRLNQSLPEHYIYKEGFVGTIAGVMFFMNTESPTKNNSGTTTSTALQGVYSEDLGAETVNGAGVKIGRVIITGKGCMYEKCMDENQFITEAGVNGKIGEFNVTNNGMQVLTEKIRLILRAPMDRLQQKVGIAWSISTSFAAPSDITAPSGPERYKRAVCLEHALA